VPVPVPEPADLLERVRAIDEELVDGALTGAVDERTVDELLAALGSGDAKVRAAAAAALARAGDPRAVKPLRTAAIDPVPAVRAVALAALVRLSPDKLLPEMVKSLRADDARVVAGAAVVLGHAVRMGANAVRSAVPNLVAAFQTDDAAVGRAVAWALGCIGDRAVVPWLVAALEQGFAAAAAAEALGRIADPRAEPALLTALADDDVAVRSAAARALGRTGAGGDAAMVARLELLLGDPDGRVRLCAALALYERGEDAAALVEALGPASGPTPGPAPGQS
jgi:HEAT repeat protein